ncbi:MAG: phytoene desaturase family protein [Marinifilaceae bacterium]|jgi:phytoene desaturase|nr:phytoene desaturase family protein [Marinifilaceae bacterium]
MKNNKQVLIVGTGLGGLSTGLRLAKQGYHVKFVEKYHKAGGRLNQISKDGFTFDIGPSFFSMPYEFEEMMNDCGIEMPFKFVELDPLYTVNFKGNPNKFYIHKDIDKMAEQFEGIESNFKEKFNKYLKKCEEIYNDTIDIVIKQNFNSIPDYVRSLMNVNPKHLNILLKSFWQQVNKYFESKEARQIISLIAFFLGRTPFDTNAVYTLLSHIEFTRTGYYNVENGMYTIVESLVDKLKELNCDFHYSTEIIDYESNRDKLTGLIDKHGKVWTSDIFVINADAALFRGSVLNRTKYNDKNLSKMNWTMGYLCFYLGIDTKLEQVEHHNYFLGDNYEDYSKHIMKNPGILEKPYYYVNAISKHNSNCAPENCEALFFVCPVPNLIYKTDWSDKDDIIDSIIEDFSSRINFKIKDHIITRLSFGPKEWRDNFNLYQGSGLGLSHHMLQIGALRPRNYDEKFKNCFYVGASTVPGAGLPMSVISSKLAEERVNNYCQ